MFCCLVFYWGTAFSAPPNLKIKKTVIADRAASAYLVEHSLPSVAMAVALGSDYIQLDLTMTADGRVIVFHDLSLERMTDVAARFPGRQRDDGKFYVVDFTLAEIQQLALREPVGDDLGDSGPFPSQLEYLHFTIPTLEEELELIRGLEKRMGRTIGIAPEIKNAWFYKREGRDLSFAVLKILSRFAYKSVSNPVFLQSYDPDELKRIRKELFPKLSMELKLIQLIGTNDGTETMVEEWGKWVGYNYDWIFTRTGIRSMASSVAGIGIDKQRLLDAAGEMLLPDFVTTLHDLGMEVHILHLNKKGDFSPPYSISYEQALEFFYFTLGVDAIHTDSCDEAVKFLQERPADMVEQEETLPISPPQDESETANILLSE